MYPLEENINDRSQREMVVLYRWIKHLFTQSCEGGYIGFKKSYGVCIYESIVQFIILYNRSVQCVLSHSPDNGRFGRKLGHKFFNLKLSKHFSLSNAIIFSICVNKVVKLLLDSNGILNTTIPECEH